MKAVQRANQVGEFSADSNWRIKTTVCLMFFSSSSGLLPFRFLIPCVFASLVLSILYCYNSVSFFSSEYSKMSSADMLAETCELEADMEPVEEEEDDSSGSVLEEDDVAGSVLSDRTNILHTDQVPLEDGSWLQHWKCLQRLLSTYLCITFRALH